MSTTPDETQWFQWIIGGLVGLLTLLFGWTQRQIGQVKKDAELADANVRRETLDAVTVLRADLNRRYEETAALSTQRHTDNRMEMAQTRETIERMAASNTIERQRFVDHLGRIADRLGQMADREEIRSMITDERRNERQGRRREPGG